MVSTSLNRRVEGAISSGSSPGSGNANRDSNPVRELSWRRRADLVLSSLRSNYVTENGISRSRGGMNSNRRPRRRSAKFESASFRWAGDSN